MSENRFVEIGRKGGFAGKGSPRRKAAALKAATIRWQPLQPRRRRNELKLRIVGHQLFIDGNADGLAESLSYTQQYRVGRTVRREEETFLYRDESGVWTLAPFLSRVTATLGVQRRPFRVHYDDSRVHPLAPGKRSYEGLSHRDSRMLNQLLRRPFGGMAYVATEKRIAVAAAILRAFPERKALVFAWKRKRVEELRRELTAHLKVPIGILAGSAADDAAIIVATAAQLPKIDEVITPGEIDLVIWDEIPKKAPEYLRALIQFWRAQKYGFLGRDEQDPARLLAGEAIFGPLAAR